VSALAPAEARRRALHAATAVLAPAALALPPPAAHLLFALLLGLAGALEAARLTMPSVQLRLERLAGPVFRLSERRRVTGASLLAGGYALAWWLFSPADASRAIAVSAFADPAAAAVGGRFGGGAGGKTWLGSGVAFAAALLVLLASGAGPLAGAAAALAAALAERAPALDNLTVPLAVGATLAAIP
jgi:dolichol kinase